MVGSVRPVVIGNNSKWNLKPQKKNNNQAAHTEDPIGIYGYTAAKHILSNTTATAHRMSSFPK